MAPGGTKRDRCLATVKQTWRHVAGAAVTLVLAGCASEGSSRARSVDGVILNYETTGTGSPALVFVHGWAGSTSVWSEQSPLAEITQVVSLDLGGHGLSSADRSEWTIDSFAADVEAVVNDLGLEEVVLVGHSMGSPVALEAAHRLGERVAAVVHVDAFGALDQKPGTAGQEEFLSGFRGDYPSAVEAFARTMFTPDSDPDLVDRVVKLMSTTPAEVGLGAFSGVYRWLEMRTPTAFTGLRVTQFFINSRVELDPDEAAALGIQFETAAIRGVGHFPMLEVPDQFNAHLVRVLEAARGCA